MNKICHVTSAHSRNDTRIFHKECVSLANNGYDVTLLIAEKEKDVSEKKNGVSIFSVKFNPKNKIDRIINSPRVLLKKAIEINADIYHFHDPELLQIAMKIKRKGKKVVFDSHEDVCGQILGKKWIPRQLRPIVSFLYKCYSNRILSKLDYLIGVTPHLVEKLKRVNPKTELITNYPVLYLDVNNIDVSYCHRKSFCFAGGITKQWNHETILLALENIDSVYDLIGRADLEYISKLKEYKSWNKVKYHGIVPQEEVKKILGSCDVGLAVLDCSDNTCGKIGTLGNTKLFEYMQAGLPVICTDFVLWKEIIDKWKCGICIPPGDVGALQKAMQYIIDNPDKAKKMGENGRRAVLEEFNWGKEEKKLISLYSKLV